MDIGSQYNMIMIPRFVYSYGLTIMQFHMSIWRAPKRTLLALSCTPLTICPILQMPSRKNRYLPYEVDTSPCHFTDSQPGPSSCEIDKSKQRVLNSASGGAVSCRGTIIRTRVAMRRKPPMTTTTVIMVCLLLVGDWWVEGGVALS